MSAEKRGENNPKKSSAGSVDGKEQLKADPSYEEELTHENLRVFGLSEAEADTFIALYEGGPMSVSKLSRESRVPRTTINSILPRLKGRGFIRKLPRKYKSVWKVKDLDKIRGLLRETVSHLAGEPVSGVDRGLVGGVEASDIGIEVFHGKQEVEQAYEYILEHSEAERIYAIQGNTSAKASVEVVDDRYLFSLHERLRKSGVIIEAINGEAVLELFKTIRVSLLESHLDRRVISYIAPDYYMDFDLDILVMRRMVVMTNVRTETVITITYEPLVETMRMISMALSDMSRKVDLNEYIRQIVAEKG